MVMRKGDGEDEGLWGGASVMGRRKGNGYEKGLW